MTLLEPSGPPAAVVAFGSGTNNAFATWTPPSLDQSNGVILYYTVVLTDLTFGTPQLSFNTTNNAINWTRLEEYVRYSVQVSAATIAGLGPFSSPKDFLTLEDGKFDSQQL